MVAYLAHLDEIFPTCRYLLSTAHSSAIAIDCIDRFSSSHNRGVPFVASGR